MGDDVNGLRPVEGALQCLLNTEPKLTGAFHSAGGGIELGNVDVCVGRQVLGQVVGDTVEVADGFQRTGHIDLVEAENPVDEDDVHANLLLDHIRLPV